jgi:MFS transporter, ACS family, hexuronate transporter
MESGDSKTVAAFIDSKTIDSELVHQAEESINVSGKVGNYRWMVCALLFFAATINYVDRQVIAVLKPTLQTQYGWSEISYSWIVFSFQTAYAIGLLFVGKLMDRIGTRRGFSLSLILWSIAAMAHAVAYPIGVFATGILVWILVSLGYTTTAGALSVSVVGFIIVRFILGLGEAGNFPASIKTVAEWFPKKERALATGIFNAGTNVGALATPLLVPVIVTFWGWYEAFIITGALGFIWLAFWLIFYRKPEEHPKISKAELAYIQSDPPEPTTKIPWAKLFPHRQTWAFAIGKFLTDPVWWVYLFWLPDFLKKHHGLDLKTFGIPLAVIYIIADVGSVGGGYISSALIKRGWTINRSRKTAMLVCALAVVPIVFASITSHLWVAVILIGIAAAAHQGWSANIFTIASDMFPKQAIGSVVGFGGMAGAVGGMLFSLLVGPILERTGNYFIIFIIAGSAYLIALLIIHLLAPKLEPARLNTDTAA